MMLFDYWFEQKYPEGSIKPEIMRQSFKEVAHFSWLASERSKSEEIIGRSGWPERDQVGLLQMMKQKEMSAQNILRMGLRLVQYRDHMAEQGFTEMQFATRDGVIFVKPSKLPPDFEG